MLKKISGPLGSIPGGWYEDTETGGEFYVKFYTKEITAKLEYFANLVYQKIGIYVPEKKLDIFDGQLAVISKKVGSGERAHKEEQRMHPDLIAGFVADAYLNNWDVVGEHFDNIVKDVNGHLYRVDNGGTGPIRANEGRKNFSPDSIPELDDMRDPKFQAGYVFENLSDEDIHQQANKLIAAIDESFLADSIASLGLDKDDATRVLDGFLGRRFYLMNKYAKVLS